MVHVFLALGSLLCALVAAAHAGRSVPLIVWGSRVDPNSETGVTVGFIYGEMDAVEFSLQAGAYQDLPCRAGSIKCQFGLVREMVESAQESLISFEPLAPSPRQRVVSLAQLEESVQSARAGDVLLVELAGSVKDEAYLHNDVVITKACSLAKAHTAQYTCFLTGKSPKAMTAASRRALQTSVMSPIDMTPELFMGMLLCFIFTLTLILFFCCTDNIEAQTFFAPKYAPKGKVFE